MSSQRLYRAFLRYFAQRVVADAYAGILRRAPDADGLRTYVEDLADHRDLATTLRGMAQSQEAWEHALDDNAEDAWDQLFAERSDEAWQRLFAERSDEAWKQLFAEHAETIARSVFQSLLNRAPEPDALAHYTKQIVDEGGVKGAVTDISHSREHWQQQIAQHAAELVAGIFRAALGREPEEKAAASYANQIVETKEIEPVLRDVLASEEHWEKLYEKRAADLARRHFSALVPEMVRSTYLSLFGREPDPSGMETYSRMIKAPQDLTRLLTHLLKSEEYHKHRIRTLHAPHPAARYEEPTLVFLHVEKTGGTALRNAIARAFDRDAIFQEHADTLYKRSPSELSQYSIFGGHFNHDSLAFIPRKTLTLVSFVREPAKRLVSLYHFWRAHEPGHRSFGRAMQHANDLLIADFFEHPEVQLGRGVWNHMTWVLLGDRQWRRWREELTTMAPELAHEHIARNIKPRIQARLREFAFIGLQEDFERSLSTMFRILNVPEPVVTRDHSLEALMQSEPNFKSDLERQPVTPRAAEAMEKLIVLDRIVYDEAVALYRALPANAAIAANDERVDPWPSRATQ